MVRASGNSNCCGYWIMTNTSHSIRNCTNVFHSIYYLSDDRDGTDERMKEYATRIERVCTSNVRSFKWWQNTIISVCEYLSKRRAYRLHEWIHECHVYTVQLQYRYSNRLSLLFDFIFIFGGKKIAFCIWIRIPCVTRAMAFNFREIIELIFQRKRNRKKKKKKKKHRTRSMSKELLKYDTP